MEREITTHLVPGSQSQLSIFVTDEPGAGGANHEYSIAYTNEEGELIPLSDISFQNGGIVESGVNGITNEVLLAMVIDRLNSFQAGPYPCDENAAALGFAYNSLHWLQERTRKRIAAQVEGISMAIPSAPLGVQIPANAKSLADEELSEAAQKAIDDGIDEVVDKDATAASAEAEQDAKQGTDSQTG